MINGKGKSVSPNEMVFRNSTECSHTQEFQSVILVCILFFFLFILHISLRLHKQHKQHKQHIYHTKPIDTYDTSIEITKPHTLDPIQTTQLRQRA